MMSKTSAQTPVFLAILFSKKQVVVYLLDHGADINIQDNRGCTVLTNAAHDNNIQVVDVLLSQGANPNLYASGLGADCPEGRGPLFISISAGHTEIAKRFIKAGADVNYGGSKGITPLTLIVLRLRRAALTLSSSW